MEEHFDFNFKCQETAQLLKGWNCLMSATAAAIPSMLLLLCVWVKYSPIVRALCMDDQFHLFCSREEPWLSERAFGWHEEGPRFSTWHLLLSSSGWYERLLLENLQKNGALLGRTGATICPLSIPSWAQGKWATGLGMGILASGKVSCHPRRAVAISAFHLAKGAPHSPSLFRDHMEIAGCWLWGWAGIFWASL